MEGISRDLKTTDEVVALFQERTTKKSIAEIDKLFKEKNIAERIKQGDKQAIDIFMKHMLGAHHTVSTADGHGWIARPKITFLDGRLEIVGTFADYR